MAAADAGAFCNISQFVVEDANGIVVATVYCRDDLQKWALGHSKLTFDEAGSIAKAISRIPEFMMQRRASIREELR